nr:MATE family efflux transporter [Clostridia bacterium]
LFNTALDLLFVGVLKWSVAGAALSTVLAQLLSAVLVFRALAKADTEVKLTPRNLRFHRSALASTVRLGFPIALQSSLYPIANIVIQSNINRMGTDNIAAWALCGKLDFAFWLAVDALAAAVSTFTAQNYGAGRFVRIRKGVRTGMGLTLWMTAGISAALYFWSEPLGLLFLTRQDLQVIRLGARFMRFLAPLYFFYAIGEILSGVLRGMGETLRPMILTLIGTWAFRILWMWFVVPRSPGMLTILGSYPASWLTTCILFVGFYGWFQSKRRRALADASAGMTRRDGFAD